MQSPLGLSLISLAVLIKKILDDVITTQQSVSVVKPLYNTSIIYIHVSLIYALFEESSLIH